MGLQWYGNPDWCDERPPSITEEVRCQLCGEEMFWYRPMNYHGAPPRHPHPCGGMVYRTKHKRQFDIREQG